MLLMFLKLIAWLPLPVLHTFAHPLGWLLYGLQTRQRYYAETNLALCFPELSEAERRSLTRRSLVATVKVLLESPLLFLGRTSRVLNLVREVSGEALLKERLARGKGVIIICPHLGNWEVAGLYVSRHYPITTMYRPQRHPGMDAMIKQGRERFGARLVPSNNKGMRDLLRTLQQGEVIGTLPDQNPGVGTGVFVPFFGIMTYTPVFAGRLANRTGASVVMVVAERLPWGRGFRIKITPVSEGIHAADNSEAAASMNHDLETIIRATPKQYWWGYNRFRTRPEGEPPIYKTK
jgi:KDO2-lipid IV(A) lauroyltransferase